MGKSYSHLKTTPGWLILHILFSILSIGFIAGIGFIFGMGIAIFPPFAYIGCALVAFLLNGLVSRILNEMGYLSIKAFIFGLLFPIMVIIVVFIIVLNYFDPPVVNYSDGKFPLSLIAIPCVIISFVSWLIAYLTHAGKCSRCGTKGVCIYKQSSSLSGKDYDFGAESHYGSIGTYHATFSDGSTESGSIEGTSTSVTIIENRNYTHNYRCKCCGKKLTKYKRLEGVNIFRKIKDAIQHEDETNK